jgi:spore photoproduct lyase
MEAVIVEKGVRHYPWVQQMLTRCQGMEIEEVEDVREVIRRHHGLPYPADKSSSQRLLLGRHRGTFLKHCPCSPCSRGCGYHFLHIGIGCPIECSYCFLPGFIDTSFPLLLVNFDDLEQELAALAQQKKPLRMGTGEMTDSLIFEPLTGFARYLTQMFAQWPHLTLELKTKSLFVDSLLDVASKNVVIAWSLNPAAVAAIEEPLAPLPEDRLRAAERCCAAGYRVGFHFDPIIACPDWQEHYHKFLQQMFARISPLQIAWISLGTFRILPQLRDYMRRRFPQTQTILGELVTAYDGKLRYFRPKRAEIYRQMIAWIRDLCGTHTPPLYLCMESQELWHDAGLAFPCFTEERNQNCIDPCNTRGIH